MQPAPGPSSALPRCWIQLLPGQRLWGWGRSQRVCGVSPTLQGLSPGCREAHTVSSECHLLGHLSKLCQLGSTAGTASHCCLSPAGPSHPHPGVWQLSGPEPLGQSCAHTEFMSRKVALGALPAKPFHPGTILLGCPLGPGIAKAWLGEECQSSQCTW